MKPGEPRAPHGAVFARLAPRARTTGSLPQGAWQLDANPEPHPNEIACDVEALNIDSASFRQIADVCDDDAARIAAHVIATVAERGKQHNAVTGSGGMFVGRVRAIGSDLAAHVDLRPGDRIASLVSLTLTPLCIDSIERVDLATGRLSIHGSAILFASALYAKLPEDFSDDVALAILDVAGAPAQVRRLTSPGDVVAVLGADGKSGTLACVAARERTGPEGLVIGIGPDAATHGARLLERLGYVDAFIESDARDALGTRRLWQETVRRLGREGTLADLSINCVNVTHTELASILIARDRGTVYFFSMATSFSAAALGAEGAGRDVTMIVGNGYARDHAAIALQLVRDHPSVRASFEARYGATSSPASAL